MAGGALPGTPLNTPAAGSGSPRRADRPLRARGAKTAQAPAPHRGRGRSGAARRWRLWTSAQDVHQGCCGCCSSGHAGHIHADRNTTGPPSMPFSPCSAADLPSAISPARSVSCPLRPPSPQPAGVNRRHQPGGWRTDRMERRRIGPAPEQLQRRQATDSRGGWSTPPPLPALFVIRSPRRPREAGSPACPSCRPRTAPPPANR